VKGYVTKQADFESPALYNSDSKLSYKPCSMMYSQVISCIKMELVSGVLETSSISIIRGYCDE
jgi:hypothetical protein